MKRTIKVTGDIGEYRQNQELTIEADIVEYLRTVLNEGADMEIALIDEEILTSFREFYDAYNGWSEDTEIMCIQALEGLSS